MLRNPLLSSHHSFLLAKVSLRPKLNHVMRCVPPSLLSTALNHFDKYCDDLLTTKIAPQIRPLSLPAFARSQISLPASYGGLGLPNSLTTSLAAFVASTARAVQDVQPLLDGVNLDPDSGECPATCSLPATRSVERVPLSSFLVILSHYGRSSIPARPPTSKVSSWTAFTHIFTLPSCPIPLPVSQTKLD